MNGWNLDVWHMNGPTLDLGGGASEVIVEEYPGVSLQSYDDPRRIEVFREDNEGETLATFFPTDFRFNNVSEVVVTARTEGGLDVHLIVSPARVQV